jgi:hypothetical protein
MANSILAMNKIERQPPHLAKAESLTMRELRRPPIKSTARALALRPVEG